MSVLSGNCQLIQDHNGRFLLLVGGEGDKPQQLMLDRIELEFVPSLHTWIAIIYWNKASSLRHPGFKICNWYRDPSWGITSQAPCQCQSEEASGFSFEAPWLDFLFQEHRLEPSTGRTTITGCFFYSLFYKKRWILITDGSPSSQLC